MSDSADDTTPASTGRRIFCKSDDSAPDVAKKISMAALPDAHHGFPVRVFCKRKVAVNTSVKAVAIATKRLKGVTDAPIDIVCVPSFRENRNEVSLYITKLDAPEIETMQATNHDSPLALKAGAKTDIKICAGAIANAARQNECSELQVIGQDAVFQAIRAIAVAREYLRDKKDDLDIYCTAEFTMVQFEGRDDETTAVKLSCHLAKNRIVTASGDEE